MAWDKTQGTDPKYRTAEHRRYRAHLVTQLKREGYLTCTAATCLFTSRDITNPNGRDTDGLHAGHNDTGDAYVGPQHNACNVRDGAVRARARQETNNRTW